MSNILKTTAAVIMLGLAAMGSADARGGHGERAAPAGFGGPVVAGQPRRVGANVGTPRGRQGLSHGDGLAVRGGEAQRAADDRRKRAHLQDDRPARIR